MIVCICHRVSDRDIACAVRHGCARYEDLQDELRVATACGTCDTHARKTFLIHAQPAHGHGLAAGRHEAAHASVA
ncbi:MAG: (2Fe-2S)-binding protein [Burkholderiaceae bacterium]